MQVDWAGTKMQVVDPITGRTTKTSIFVATLPYSGLVFAYGYLDEKLGSWCDAHRGAFEHAQGIALHDYEILLLDDFLTTQISSEIASELLNILAAREHRGSTIITSQFDPEDWCRSLHGAVSAESILNRLVSKNEMIQLDGPNMRRHEYVTMQGSDVEK